MPNIHYQKQIFNQLNHSKKFHENIYKAKAFLCIDNLNVLSFMFVFQSYYPIWQ